MERKMERSEKEQTWKRELRRSINRQTNTESEYQQSFGMKSVELKKIHELILIPKGKIVDIKKISKMIKGPIGTSNASDAVAMIKDPIIVFVQVSDLSQIELDELRISTTTGFVRLWKGGPKAIANGTLWIATDKIPQNVDEIKKFMNVVVIDEKEDLWMVKE